MTLGKGPYDTVQFIWNDFKRQNYTTGYIEDDPKFALFNYLAKGFKKPPTDWYTRPYWMKMDYDRGNQERSLCYKQKPKIIYWLKQIKQFLNKVNKTKQPFFLWSFYIQVTHDDFNNAQLIDQYIADFINSYRHILENTVFVVMGDHGNRFGPLSRTEYGQIETRMPLFNIHVPPQLLHKHQHLAHHLKMNEKRLTTWLDVRKMLKDIVSDNYEPIVSSSKRDAYSVWREEVPLDRTCKDALIPMEFCLCIKKQSFLVDSQLAQIVSTALVTRLNQALSKSNNICYELSLKEIHNVKIVRLPGEPNPRDRVEVTLSVNPSNGLFQAQLYLKNAKNLNNSGIDDWILEGDVSRLDSYGNQSSCINDRVLRKYCYCRKIIHSR
uniref:Sulfatase N-terminal domain-containing protein n=1 Tax=Tetranychus urticae TaxID=32264 RepID=T1KAW4_TETUR